MPLYFFHVRDGKSGPDTEGSELPDDAAARQEAISAASETVGELGKKFWDGGDWILQVVEHTGRLVMTLRFSGSIDYPVEMAAQ